MKNKRKNPLKVADLFCGMGGLGYGFVKAGFNVTGFDKNEKAGMTYVFNRIGNFIMADLIDYNICGDFGIIIGGPPCEPWSRLNVRRRREKHPLRACVKAFFREIRRLHPLIFVMENVLAIRSDQLFKRCIGQVEGDYDICMQVIRYSDYGAATARRRLFVIGVHLSLGFSAQELFTAIRRERPRTVREAIFDLRDRKWDPSIDHVWPAARTIHKYRRYYETGKYGWYILEWDRPAPSFGNIAKTYILHPDAPTGKNVRPISVREALRIMGFPDDFKFPNGIGMHTKYEMIADAVSPVFSLKLARVIKSLLIQ